MAINAPWSAERREEHNGWWTVHDKDGKCVDDSADGGFEEDKARLIAAAPDLLGAMRFVLAFYEPGQTHLDTNAWRVAEASARAAVAKAEGRT